MSASAAAHCSVYSACDDPRVNSTRLQAPPGLHIILGDSAGGIFTRNYGRQDLLVDRDVLSVGPTSRCADFAAWKAMRSAFWREVVPDETLHPPTLNIADDADRLRAAERINHWAATGVTEQLSIAFTIHVIDELGIDPARLRLLQFEQYRDRPRHIAGMGELNEENMAAHPEPRSFTPQELEDYRVAWGTLTAAKPETFERFPAQRPQANQFLKNAMQLMLRRFPDQNTGLVHWDRVLLESVRAHGPNAARVIGHALMDGWDSGDLVGDAYLFARLRRLADESLAPPRVRLSGARTSMRDTQVELTQLGAATP